MTFQLRSYQILATDAAKEFLRTSTEPCLIDAAPAAGKSFCVAEMARWFREVSGNKRVLCLQPNSKLVKQNVEKFRMTGENCSIFSASAGAKSTRHGVVYATPKTVRNSISRFKQGYCAIIIDEAHSLTPTIIAIIDAMREQNPNLRILGLTGTPYRMLKGYIFRVWPDGRVNGDDVARDPFFFKMVYRVTAREMLDAKRDDGGTGFITPMEICAVNDSAIYDTSGVKMLANGTLDQGTVESAFEGHGRQTAACVRDIMAQVQTKGVKGGVMIFAATQRHAQEVMASLPPGNSALSTGDHGILMGRPASDDQIVKAYRNREFRYLVSVNKYSVGFDVDHTEFLALLRYSESPDLTVQILGRAWRLHPDKPLSYVADYSGNIDRHFPDGDIYNPEIRTKGSGGEGVMIDAECPDCGYVNEFSLNVEYADYQRDKHGYALDVFGNQLVTEHGPLSTHYGRRCLGVVPSAYERGRFDRCGYRWNGKECPECGEQNDIAARYCYACKAEIVDPGRRLVIDFVAAKRDPSIPQCDRIVSLDAREGMSQRGNQTVRLDIVTEFRQFSVWLMPEPKNARAAADWARWKATGGNPETVTYVKEASSGFFRVLAWNHEPDDAALPDHIVQREEVVKLRKYA